MKLVLTMENLENCFEKAKLDKYEYIGLSICMNGFTANEVIINPIVNFDKKLEYIKATYDDFLNHKYSNGIAIGGFTFGDSYADIEKDLV